MLTPQLCQTVPQMAIKIRFLMILSSLICLLSAEMVYAADTVIPFTTAREITKNNGRRECPHPLPEPVRTLELNSIYDQEDPSRSQIDAENKERYENAIAHTRAFLIFITRYASNYTQTDGNRLDGAACALEALTLWARADALSDLKSRQTYHSMTRVIAGSAIAFMQVKAASDLLEIETSVIERWLTRRAQSTIPIYTQTGNLPSNRQNHRYWAGLAVAAVGVITGRRDFLDFGYHSYQIGICQVTTNGALPLELDRKKRARDYHLHALAPLVMLASITHANGYDALSLCNGSLQKLARFALDSIKDPIKVEGLTGVKQVSLPREKNGLVRRDRIAWLEVYLSLYPKERSHYQDLYDSPLFSSNLGGRLSAIYNFDFRN